MKKKNCKALTKMVGKHIRRQENIDRSLAKVSKFIEDERWDEARKLIGILTLLLGPYDQDVIRLDTELAFRIE